MSRTITLEKKVPLFEDTALIPAVDNKQNVLAYLVRRDRGGWKIVQPPLRRRELPNGGGPGYAVALSDRLAVVGCWQQQESGFPGIGVTYVFRRKDEPLSWEQDGVPLQSPSRSAEVHFGRSVAIVDSETILIGGYGANESRGAVWAFKTEPAGWQCYQELGTGFKPRHWLGTSIAYAGGIAVVGGPHGNEVCSVGAGEVRTFERGEDGSWDFVERITGQNTGDGFGISVAVDDNARNLFVGAYRAEKAANSRVHDDAGAAYAFQKIE
jgi:hypothetical protein